MISGRSAVDGVDASPIVAYGFGDGLLHLGARRPHRAGTLSDELQGGNDVSLEEDEILIRPEEGAHLSVSVLDGSALGAGSAFGQDRGYRVRRYETH
jgi:hypothetical protein